jgi:hypothetical protein
MHRSDRYRGLVVRHSSRALRWGAVGAAGIALASCSSGVTVPRAQGTISGTASTCSTTHHAHFVTVVVLEDSILRTSATIRSGTHFRFHLSPGHYVVTTGPLFSHVTLSAGGSVTVNLKPACTRQAP